MRETGWLIEFPRVNGQQMYYGKTIEGLGSTSEHLDAIRFSRKQDAQAIAEAIAEVLEVKIFWSVAEHAWTNNVCPKCQAEMDEDDYCDRCANVAVRKTK